MSLPDKRGCKLANPRVAVRAFATEILLQNMTPTSGKPVGAAKSPIYLKQILVPIDFSTGAEEALEFAIDLADKFGASLTLIHVLELSQYAHFMTVYPDFVAQPIDIGELEASSRKDAEARLTKLIGPMEKRGVKVRTMVRVGFAATEILRAAEKEGADCIVISTHGYSGMTRFLLGSTTERVVRHAHCPVMVVRLKEHLAA